MKICIDAGHNYSNFDTGVSSNGLKEQNITFPIAKMLKELLEKVGVEVIMTRKTLEENLGTTTNSSLKKRVKISNEAKCDYFISIHCNAGGGTGTEVLVIKKGGKAEELAEAVLSKIVSKLKLRDRGVKEQNVCVLRETDCPAIVVETAFVDHAQDSLLLKNSQKEFAEAIFEGVREYLKLPTVNEPVVDAPTVNKPVVDEPVNTVPSTTSSDVPILKDGLSTGVIGKNLDGTTYVPLRAMMNQFSYDVEWDAVKNTANVVTQKSAKPAVDTNKVEAQPPKVAESTDIPPVQPTVYKTIGVTNVIEIDPRNIFHVETQCATNKTPYDNFVNSLFFMNQSNGIMYPQGIAVNAGQVLANNPTHGKPVATLIIRGWNQVELKYITDITKEENVWFAVSGYGVYPNITASQEGFTGKFSDVLRSTNRPIIGYRKADNKVVIAVRSGSDATRANLTAKNLGLDFAISLDAGGSTTLKQKGKYIYKGDCKRKLWGGIIWG